MRIAIIGDRGIPARYSGFSTLVEELAVRLVADHAMDVTVYGRRPYFDQHPASYRGVRLIWMSAPGGKRFESIVHTNRAVWHAAAVRDYDLVFIVDPGNGPFCLPLKAVNVPVVYHTDGLGWKRTKWSRLERRYYKWSEKVTARLADWLVTDSRAMVAYYQSEYRVPCTFVPYGSIVGNAPRREVLDRFGLGPGEYYLVVARLEPENNTLLVIREFKKSRTRRPLVVVGGVPYASAYVREVMAERDDRVKIIGSIYESEQLNALWQNCLVYIHAHEVGGTNPSLLRAMAAGCACLPIGVEFNREVVGHDVPFFTHEPGSLSRVIDQLDRDRATVAGLAGRLQARSRELYRWDAVSAAYAAMFRDVVEMKRKRKPRASVAAGRYYRPEDFTANWEDWPDREAPPTPAPARPVGPG